MKRILLLMLFVGGITMANAQQATEKVSYTVSGGLLGAANFSQFRSDKDAPVEVNYDFKTGWAIGGWVNFPVTSHFSVEPQLLYSSYRYKTDYAAPLLLNDGRISYISLPILLKYGGKGFGVTAGPQIDFFSSVEDNVGTAQNSDFKKTSLALTAGFEILPHERVTIFGRYIHGLTNLDQNNTHGAIMEFKNQVIQAGLKIKLFGKKKTETTFQAAPTPAPEPVPDRDGDGITDDVDKCPDVAGLPRYNGCPIPDSDGDGINDEEDKCPNVAGLAKYNGCPIPDSDGDGCNDEEDKCPNQAGTAKYNCCPIPDKDGDGINDEEDKCPDIAGIAANNGCPEVPANVTKLLQVSSQGVYFGTGTKNATLTARSNPALDKVVTIMNENPGLFVRVEAHTDNAGDDAANMKLTQDRADAVKAYLVDKGISADRITAVGMGESTPIADNNTVSGRAKNRRVEIKMAF